MNMENLNLDRKNEQDEPNELMKQIENAIEIYPKDIELTSDDDKKYFPNFVFNKIIIVDAGKIKILEIPKNIKEDANLRNKMENIGYTLFEPEVGTKFVNAFRQQDKTDKTLKS